MIVRHDGTLSFVNLSFVIVRLSLTVERIDGRWMQGGGNGLGRIVKRFYSSLQRAPIFVQTR